MGHPRTFVHYGRSPLCRIGSLVPHLGERGEQVAWIVLMLSGVLEAGWALSLKASDGLSKLWPSVAFVVLLIASMAGLMFALKTLPVGPAYAVWVGIGAVLTAVIGMVAFKDPVNVVTIGSIVLIIAGVVGLQLAGAGH